MLEWLKFYVYQILFIVVGGELVDYGYAITDVSGNICTLGIPAAFNISTSLVIIYLFEIVKVSNRKI